MPIGGRKLSLEEALALCYVVGFRAGPLRTAVGVMTAESGRTVEAYNINSKIEENAQGDPVVVRTSLDRGLFQVNTLHSPLGMADSFKAVPNARFAFVLSDGGENFTPWNAFNSGAHEQFMRDVRRTWTAGEWQALIPTIEEMLAGD
jgi:hypothetical protein